MPRYSSHNVSETEPVSLTTVPRIHWDDCSGQLRERSWGAGHREAQIPAQVRKPRGRAAPWEQSRGGEPDKRPSSHRISKPVWGTQQGSCLPPGPSSSSVQVQPSQPWDMSREAGHLKKPETWSAGLPEALQCLQYSGFQSSFHRASVLDDSLAMNGSLFNHLTTVSDSITM